MWLFATVLASLCYAFLNVLDEYYITYVFEKPWMGTVVSAMASTVAFVTIPMFLPLAVGTLPSVEVIVYGLLAGTIIQANQTLYFYALRDAEVGIASAYWTLSPVVLLFVNYLFFDERLSVVHYAGIVILLTSAIIFCLSDSNAEKRAQSLLIGLLGAGINVVEYLLFQQVFEQTSFFMGFQLINIGVVASGLLPLLFRRARTSLLRHSHMLVRLTKIFIILEVIHVIAYGSLAYGVKMGTTSLVSAVEASTPGMTFILAIASFHFISRHTAHKHVLRRLPLKFGGVALMIFGIYLVS